MSNKKPSELAAWNNDKTMVMHAHKPGVSQKISIQEIIDAVPVPEVSDPFDISEKGKELVALETVAEMKALLEVPEAGDGGGDGLVAQDDWFDSAANKVLKTGAFGLGSIVARDLGDAGFTSESTNIPNGFYTLRNSSLTVKPAGVNPGASANRFAMLSMRGESADSGFQILNTNYHGLFIRRRSNTGWSEWYKLDVDQLGGYRSVGSVIVGIVIDPSRGTLDNYGVFTEITGRYGVAPAGFDGQVIDTPAMISGTWTQISRCDHDSENPVSRLALYKRIK